VKECGATKCSWMQVQLARWLTFKVVSSSISRQGGELLNNTLRYVFWALCNFVPRRKKSIESDFGAVFLPPGATRLH